MPGDELSIENRTKLDGIVQQMTDNKESEDNIHAVVEDFKSKYSVKKKVESTTSPVPSATGAQIEQNLQPQLEGGSLGSVNTVSESPLSTSNIQPSTTATPGTDFETKEPNLLTGESKEIKNISKIPAPLPYKQFDKDAARIKYDQEQAEKALKARTTPGGITDRFLAGANHLAANIAEAPAMLWNTAAAVTDPLAHALGAEGTGAVKQENAISQHFKDAEEYINDINPKSHNKGSLEYLKEGKLSDTFSALGDEVAESLPASMGLMLGGAAGAGIKGTAAIGTLVFGADKQAQLDADPTTKDLPEAQKKAIALANGFAEVLFEGNLGISKLGALTKKVFEKSGKEAAEKFAREGFDKIYSPAIKQWAGIGGENMLQEAGTQFTQNVIDKYWGVDPNKNLADNVAQAALQGLGAHAVASTAPTLLDVARTRTAAAKANDILAQKAAIKADIENPDVTPEIKTALHEKLRGLNVEEADMYKEETQKHEALPDDKKAEVDALLQKAHTLSASVADETISEPTREIMKSDLDEVEKQVEKIYEPKQQPKGDEITPESDAIIHEDFLNAFKTELTQENPVATETINPTENAVQEPSTEEILQRQPEEIASTGSERGGVESSEQGPQVTSESVQKEEVTTPTVEEILNEQKQPVTETKPIVNETQQGTANVDKSQQSTEEVSNKGEETTASKEKPKQKQELIDEEELIEAKKLDDKESVKRLNDDIAILKGFNDRDTASKKFKAIVERAFKMKEEGKISKPTYTKYRNQAQQVLGPKINLDAEEAKYKIESLKEEVKKKLLGENYKKVIMSAPGFGPKQVADLVDLTAKMVNHAIDAGFTIKEATAKALEKIKTHPYYKKLIDEGHVDEDTFRKSVESNFVKPEEKVQEKTEANKEKKKPEGTKGEKRKHAIGERITENEDKFKEVSKRLKEKGIEYESIDQQKATKVVTEIINEHAKDNLLTDLADAIIEGKSEIPYPLQGLAANKLMDKLNVMAEKEENEFLKNATFDKAAELSTWWMQEATKAGQFNGVANQSIADSLPMSKEGLRTFANKELEKLHDTVLTKEEQSEIEKVSNDINEALDADNLTKDQLAILQTMVTKEIARIAEKTRGKEFINNLSTAMESLKMDLSEC